MSGWCRRRSGIRPTCTRCRSRWRPCIQADRTVRVADPQASPALRQPDLQATSRHSSGATTIRSGSPGAEHSVRARRRRSFARSDAVRSRCGIRRFPGQAHGLTERPYRHELRNRCQDDQRAPRQLHGDMEQSEIHVALSAARDRVAGRSPPHCESNGHGDHRHGRTRPPQRSTPSNRQIGRPIARERQVGHHDEGRAPADPHDAEQQRASGRLRDGDDKRGARNSDGDDAADSDAPAATPEPPHPDRHQRPADGDQGAQYRADERDPPPSPDAVERTFRNAGPLSMSPPADHSPRIDTMPSRGTPGRAGAKPR